MGFYGKVSHNPQEQVLCRGIGTNSTSFPKLSARFTHLLKIADRVQAYCRTRNNGRGVDESQRHFGCACSSA